MNDRHNLTADPVATLQADLHALGVPAGRAWTVAGRLIDLGWTRLDEDEGPAVTVDWTNDVIAGLERQLRDCREYTLDEERLARALHRAGVRCSPNIPYCRASHRGHAAAIAKAYREDTDA